MGGLVTYTGLRDVDLGLLVGILFGFYRVRTDLVDVDALGDGAFDECL